MVAWITKINSAINGFVWGIPMLILLVGTGILMTVLTKFFQVRHAGYVTKHTFLAIFNKKDVTRTKEKKAISQFQALSTALAATIGTGNIAGVATAIAIGGPGAVFWMWVSAFFGMMTNYSENVLGIYYRRKNESGEWSGGAMYYLRDGLGSKKNMKVVGRILAILFSIFCVLASFGIGNMAQINTISDTMNTNFGLPPVVTGIFLALIAALVVIGGIKRIAQVTEKLVPFMALFYIVGTLIIFIMNYHQIPRVFSSIFADAFNFTAIAGGVGGVVIRRAVTMGFKRGVFSNEAGLGSSVMVHSASDVKEPVQQGMWGIFEVFFDTIVVCTLTAFVLLSTSISDGTVNVKNIELTPETQYVSIANADEYNGVIPLIDKQFTQVVSGEENGKLTAADEQAAVIITLGDETYTINQKAPEGEDDFIYTNLMAVTGVDTDEDGVIDSAKFEKVEGVSLVTYAFTLRFGDIAGKILSIAVLLFAFSTVLGWSFYGTKAMEYLLGGLATKIYKTIFVCFIVVGATMKLSLAWDLSDTFNGLMAIPNLIGVLSLSGLVVKITANYAARKFKGEKVEPMISIFPDLQKEAAESIMAEDK